MGRYRVVVKSEFVECPDSEEPGPGEPRQRADGGFETVISEGCAMDIGGSERALLKSAYAEMRHEIGRHLTCLSKKKAVELAGGRDVDEPAHPYHVDGEVGRFQFGTHEAAGGAGAPVNARGLFPPLKNGKERYRTPGYKEPALLQGTVEQPCRKTAALTSRFRHQDEGGTPARTLRENTVEEGGEVSGFTGAKAAGVFAEKGFSPEGLPGEEVAGPELGRRVETPPAEAVAAALEKVKADAARQTADISEGAGVLEDPSKTVDASVDGVLVKGQKAARGRPRENGDPKRVEDTVAHVERGGGSYAPVNRCVIETVRPVVALLANGGLPSMNLAFFVGGQRSLRGGIQSFLSWNGNIFIILDWFHLEKKCEELPSMATGGSQVRNGVLKRLRVLLWYGQVKQAIAYLRSLGDDSVRDYDVIEKLAGHFERNGANIPNYALRKKLGLRNSGNRVEKASDQAVANRQKHNGMSWSKCGSITQAGLKTAVMNGETRNWLDRGEIELKLAC